MNDHIINCAVTVWHLCDWLWLHHIAGDHAIRTRLNVNSLREFQDWACSQQRELRICDIVANASKHGGVAHSTPDRPEIETLMIGGIDFATLGDVTPEQAFQIVDDASEPTVLCDGAEVPMISVLSLAIQFWRDFFSTNQIIEREGTFYRRGE
jgi:hypothetical protein